MQSGLNTDEVVEILAKLDPISVLSACQTTPYLGKVCQKQDVFARLMRIHYPQFPVDPTNPKDQYGRITAGIGMQYYIPVDDHLPVVVEDSEGHVQDLVQRYQRVAYMDPELKKLGAHVKVLGTRIRTGEKIVVSLGNDAPWQAGHEQVEAFDTIENAVDSILTRNMQDYQQMFEDLVYWFYTERSHTFRIPVYDFFDEYSPGMGDDLIEYLHGFIGMPVPYEYDRGNYRKGLTYDEIVDEFNEWLSTQGQPSPFTREYLREYILLNGFYQEYNSTSTYQFFEVTMM